MDVGVQQETLENAPSSVIGADITVTGDIEATVDLLIEGKVNGNVRCQTLLLGESSAIKGNIYAERVRISGFVEGSVETRDLAIESSGSVTGDVSYSRLKVATGGNVEGTMRCKRDAEQKLKLVETPVQPEPEPARIVIE
jgi:cytoskeletal protein CcmA (bactofilin family)